VGTFDGRTVGSDVVGGNEGVGDIVGELVGAAHVCSQHVVPHCPMMIFPIIVKSVVSMIFPSQHLSATFVQDAVSSGGLEQSASLKLSTTDVGDDVGDVVGDLNTFNSVSSRDNRNRNVGVATGIIKATIFNSSPLNRSDDVVFPTIVMVSVVFSSTRSTCQNRPPCPTVSAPLVYTCMKVAFGALFV